MNAQGSRGGSTFSLAHAQLLFRKWKGEEHGWVKARILWIALSKGDFHGDDLADVDLSERSIIGAVVNGLVRQGLIRSTGEHRKSRTDAGHGRRSYVYVLTEKGAAYARSIRIVPREELPVRPRQVRALDQGSVRKSRRKIASQDLGLFEEGGYDTPTVPVAADEQDITARGRPAINRAEFDAAMEAWTPYRTAEEQAELEARLSTSPFLHREAPAESLSWDQE